MRKTSLWIGAWIAAGFAVGWMGFPALGASMVTVAIFLSPVALLAAAQDVRLGATS
jgi:hypothetical protein